MSQAASNDALKALHAKVAESLTNRIVQDMEDDVPTDAATLGAAIKFLKDNNISADPAEASDLTELRNKLKEQAERRKAVGNVIEFAQGDLKQAQGG